MYKDVFNGCHFFNRHFRFLLESVHKILSFINVFFTVFINLINTEVNLEKVQEWQSLFSLIALVCPYPVPRLHVKTMSQRDLRNGNYLNIQTLLDERPLFIDVDVLKLFCWIRPVFRSSPEVLQKLIYFHFLSYIK